MAIDALIFDCDGTLVDSEVLAAQVLVDLLAERGHALAYDTVLAQYRGREFAHFVATLCAQRPGLDPDELTRTFRARSLALFRERLQPIPGALELVRGLTLDKCVASNGPRQKIEACLAVTGLLPYFTGRIVSAYEVGAWKPDPRLILHAAALLATRPERCLLVEDSLAGVQAGVAAGVRVAALGLDPATLGELAGRVSVIDGLDAIPALLG